MQHSVVLSLVALLGLGCGCGSDAGAEPSGEGASADPGNSGGGPDGGEAAPLHGDGGPGGPGSSTSTSTTDGGPTQSASGCAGDLDAVQAILDVRCALAGCHGAPSPAAALDLSGSDTEGQLVGAVAALCDGFTRVVPGDQEQSLLYRKLIGTQPSDCGDAMPLGTMLPEDELDCVSTWIGALPPLQDAGTVDPIAPENPGCETCGETGCVDTQQDGRHCGACGNTCPAGASCNAGQCECLAGLTRCGDSCIDTTTNLQHCGNCDRACTGPSNCDAGQCACAEGFMLCNDSCVDVQEDAAHCGRCDRACGAGQVCKQGDCQMGACVPQTRCGDSCVDLQSSFFHCGGCDQPCDTGQACTGGGCDCAAGTALCDGACIATDADPANCGGCGVACAPGELCEGGACRCPGGGAACGGDCVDTTSDPDHCGGCDVRCGPGQTCMDGSCTCGDASASFDDVVAILAPQCASAGCHSGARPREGLSLESDAAYDALVGVAATQCNDGRALVEPGKPQASYLLDKLLGTNLCAGSQMPKAGQTLPTAEVEMISNWICSGAPAP